MFAEHTQGQSYLTLRLSGHPEQRADLIVMCMMEAIPPESPPSIWTSECRWWSGNWPRLDEKTSLEILVAECQQVDLSLTVEVLAPYSGEWVCLYLAPHGMKGK